MKVLIVNASPRPAMNTAQILKEVQKGAESAGHQVEYVDLYSFKSFMGCRSCLACKNRALENQCHCYFKDDITDLINHVYEVDKLVLGSPIYYSQFTSGLMAFYERVAFPAMSYADYSSVFEGKVDVDVFATMNAPEDYYQANLKDKLLSDLRGFRFLNGTTTIHNVSDTLQVKDYSKFRLDSFDPVHKQEVHDTQFPKDLAAAFAFGKNISC